MEYTGGSLRGQIRYVEENIAIREELGIDASFEKSLVKEWKRYLPGGDKHHLWLRHSQAEEQRQRHVRRSVVPK